MNSIRNDRDTGRKSGDLEFRRLNLSHLALVVDIGRALQTSQSIGVLANAYRPVGGTHLFDSIPVKHSCHNKAGYQ